MAQLPIVLRRAWPHLGLIPMDRGWGTGFLVCGDKVLTARHVVGSRRSVSFKMQSGDYEAEVKFSSRDIDLAVLQLRPNAGQTLPSLPALKLSSAALPVQFIAWGYGFEDEGTPRLVLTDGEVKAYAHPTYQLQCNEDVLLHGMSGGPVAIDDATAPASDGMSGIRVFAVVEGAYTGRLPDIPFRIGQAIGVDAFPSALLKELGAEAAPAVAQFKEEQRKRRSLYEIGVAASVAIGGLAIVATMLGLIARPIGMVGGVVSLSVATALILSVWRPNRAFKLNNAPVRSEIS